MTNKIVITGFLDFRQFTKRTEQLQRLNKAYDAFPQTNASPLVNNAQQVRGYIEELHDSQTKDGYKWFCGVHFYTGLVGSSDVVAVLYPWCQDFDNKRSKLDRSIGVYYRGKVEKEDIAKVLNDLTKTFSKTS